MLTTVIGITLSGERNEYIVSKSLRHDLTVTRLNSCINNGLPRKKKWDKHAPCCIDPSVGTVYLEVEHDKQPDDPTLLIAEHLAIPGLQRIVLEHYIRLPDLYTAKDVDGGLTLQRGQKVLLYFRCTPNHRYTAVNIRMTYYSTV